MISIIAVLLHGYLFCTFPVFELDLALAITAFDEHELLSLRMIGLKFVSVNASFTSRWWISAVKCIDTRRQVKSHTCHDIWIVVV